MARKKAQVPTKSPTAEHCNGIKADGVSYCRRPAGWGTEHPGTGRCKLHGGATPRGEESTHFDHGRYCRYPSFRLHERYQNALTDPELTSLREEIALVDIQIQEQLEEVLSGRGVNDDAYEAAHKLQHAVSQEDRVEALSSLLAAVNRGKRTEEARGRVLELFEVRRKLARTETQREQKLQTTMTAVQAYALIDSIVNLVKYHVTDRSERLAVANGLRDLMEAPGEQRQLN